MHDLIIINHHGRRFGVRLVHEGMRYGLDDCLVYGGPAEVRGEGFRIDDPLVEFYDLTYTDTFGPRGQFVSRYYRSTLLSTRHGLDLDGGVPEWSVDEAAMSQVRRLLDASIQETR